MNLSQKHWLSFIFTGLIVTTPMASVAQDPIEFSANMALTNDYKFYGFSQSDEGWAIQGGIDFSHESGFYFGTWASSVDFNPDFTDPAFVATGQTGDAANIELDVYAGFAGEFGNGLGFDIGVVRYGYPDQNEDLLLGGDLDYWEVQIGVEYGFGGNWEPTVSAGIWVSPDWFGETGTSIYPNGGISFSLPEGFGLYGNVGHLDVDDIGDYTHYQIGVTKDFAGLSFDFAWADASDDCDGGTGDFCEGFVFYVSKEF